MISLLNAIAGEESAIHSVNGELTEYFKIPDLSIQNNEKPFENNLAEIT